METDEITGGCACGAVRFTMRGTPIRAGLCHCLTCRKAHAAAFNPFAVYLRAQMEVDGTLQSWRTENGFELFFCPTCGSRVFGGYPGDPEVEISLGSLDEIGRITPQYESWVIRREPWLAALDVPQNQRDPSA
ncbi:GFA family protein [Sphingomonas sp. UNC305MFCol5.2]|uniref:GFA family protein n=1 Tax=Sphingomonas sp. UNC305MFCol5.2 TaxID=1449076 RepID=UPI00056B0CF3|nr:GFA family protein [Sphingomonas sp. UNC305MFCol5.2]